MSYYIFTEPTIEPVLLLLCAGLAIASLEDYKKSDVFEKHGILSWDILRHLNLYTLNNKFWKAVGRFQNPTAFKSMLIARAFVSICIITVILLRYSAKPMLFLMIAFLLVVHLLISFRAMYGLDGAHQMNLIILIGITGFLMASPGSFAQNLCILFIGAQLVTSYVVSGIYKWRGKMWRNGSALPGIMSTYIYGHPWLGSFLQNKPVLGKAMCWLVIFFETAFIAVIFAPPEIALMFLACGFLFHAANSFLMGLNGFFFSFVATYPCVLYLNYYIREIILGLGG